MGGSVSAIVRGAPYSSDYRKDIPLFFWLGVFLLSFKDLYPGMVIMGLWSIFPFHFPICEGFGNSGLS